MNATHAPRTDAAEDQLLVELVDELTAKLQAGEPCDVSEYAARYPEYGDRLRNWMSVMTAMADLGHSLVGSDSQPLPLPSPGGSGVGVLGDFRILRELGRGGMGVVYEAEQISLGRRVALKVLPFAAMLDKQQLNRFKNEARAAGTLDHPNIVAIHSVGVERGVHYYAMQLIEGESLAQVIARLRKERVGSGQSAVSSESSSVAKTAAFSPKSEIINPKSEIPPPASPPDTAPIAALSTRPDANPREYFRTVARLGVQAAEALDHAHQNGILHRDVKPANLMVDDAGKLWITDFGLARLEADAGMTMTGDLLGTLRYMSPEQALAKRVVVDHRSDVYSLGATLYELLTLRPAYAAEDRQELLRQIAFEEPIKPRQHDGRIPRDLETIVLKAIEKNPADRYATAQVFADDLRRFVASEPIRAKSPGLVNRVMKWSRRNRGAVAAAAIIVIVVLMFTTALVADRWRQIRAGTQFVNDSLAAASAALEADRVSEATQRVSEAQSRVEAYGLSDPALLGRVNTLAAECTRYAAFKDTFELAKASRGSEGLPGRALQEGLDLYRVADGRQWLESLRTAGLPAAHVQRVADDMYELLLLNAYTVRDADKRPQAAIDLLEQAVAFHAPSRGYYWLLAKCYEMLGDRDKFLSLEEKSLEVPAFRASELWYINRDHRSVYSIEKNLKDHREMLRVDPTYYNGLFFMSYLLAREGRYAESLVGWHGCLALNPTDYVARLNRAAALEYLGHYEEALSDYQAVLALQSISMLRPSILSQMAYFLATAPADEVRDGKLALELARTACELTDYKDASIVDTLAAAYAETGDFDSAIKWGSTAIQLTEDPALKPELEAHLKSFEAHQPWREKPAADATKDPAPDQDPPPS